MICLAAVIVAGISVIYSGNKTIDEPILSYNTPVSKPISPTNPPKDSNSTPSTDASKPIDDSQKGEQSGNNAKPQGEIMLTKPDEGEIQAEFAAKKLVYNTTLQEWRTNLYKGGAPSTCRYAIALLHASLIADEQGCVGACLSDGVEEGAIQNHLYNFRFLFFATIG